MNAADVVDFGGTTGEAVHGTRIDLVVRGDSAADTTTIPDTLHLKPTGGVEFALDTSGVALHHPVYGGPATLYDVYSNGSESVAVEQGVTVNT